VSDARVLSVAAGSPAALAGVRADDLILAVNGQPLRDIIQYRLLTDEEEVHLELLRGGAPVSSEVTKTAGVPLGIEVASAVFDGVRTCDNHCEFCFIHQLPPGMRRSLSLKDDDYRLSFLYGNFTTLTRFTEADLERVVTEGLSPLYVSIHATDPELRVEMLRNRRGAGSLRWLRALLDHGVEVHGQIVVCPGLNDGAALDDTLAGILDEYPEMADVALVPLGVSRFNPEERMRPHTREEAIAVVDLVTTWQARFTYVLGHPMVHAADEYHLLAGRPFPASEVYGDFGMHEDGIGMARAFEAEFEGATGGSAIGIQSGFFAAVDGAPAEGYRAPRLDPSTSCGSITTDNTSDRATDAPRATPVSVTTSRRPGRAGGVGVLTGPLGAKILRPLIERLDRDDVRLLIVDNLFFGGNVGVTGLMVGEDLVRTLSTEPEGHRYLLPDVCLSGGRFLDGMTPDDLPRPVEIVATDGVSLRQALDTPTRSIASPASTLEPVVVSA
jgi:putative radical SAM enzyme (TIGR03279 family)